MLERCGRPEAHFYAIKWIDIQNEEDVKFVFPTIVYTKTRDSVSDLARVEFFDTDGEWEDLSVWLGVN